MNTVVSFLPNVDAGVGDEIQRTFAAQRETALRLRDPGLVYLKTDPLLNPLRQEPRFKAIVGELKFPS